MAKQRIIPIVYKVDYSQVDKSTQSVKKAEQATDKLNKEIKETETVGVKSFGALKNAIVATGVVGIVGTLAKKIFDLGVAQEQTTIAFNTFLGSAEKGKKLLAELTKFSIVTPFSPDQVNKAAKALLAFGVEGNKIIPTLKLLGDVSSGTGKDLTEMAVIFGQIRSTGRLMGQDLLQLINAGFNPLQIISQKTGKSVADLKKEMEKGLISFDMVEQAFKDATSAGGLFFNLMEKQSQTIGGKLSTIQGNLEEVGKIMFENNKGPVSDFIGLLADITSNIDGIVEAINATFKISNAGNPLFQLFEIIKKEMDAAAESNRKFTEFLLDQQKALLTTNQTLEEKRKTMANIVMLEQRLGLFKPGTTEDPLPWATETKANDIKKVSTNTKELAEAMKFLADEIETAGLQTGLWGEDGVDPMFQDALKKLEKFGDQWSAQQESQYDREFNDLVEKNEKELEEIERAEANKRDAIQQSYDLGIQLGTALLESAFEQREIDLNGIRDKYDRELALAGDNDRAKEQIQLERDKKLAQAEQRNKEIQKKNARSKILIDTGVAIIKTFSQFGYPAGIIPAALMAALGAFQAGQINKYKDGVIDLNGPGTGTSDSIPAMLSKGESVMTARETDSSMGILKAIRAKKLDDRQLEKLYNRKAGGDGVAFSDKRIVEAIKGQKQPDYTNIGSYVYEVKSKNRDHKTFIRKKYIS